MRIRTYDELEEIEQLISKKSFTDAYIAINIFIKKYGPLVEAIFLKAKISRRLRKFEESLKLFKSLNKTPEYTLESYWGQSMIYTALDEKEEAESLYTQIINYAEKLPIVRESNKALETILQDKITSKNLLLTTFPKHASNNVGDQLISFSTIELIKSRIADFDPIVEFRATNLDKYENTMVENIIAPGFSICDKTYPELFGLYSDIKNLPNFYPIGCSFQHIEPSFEAFDSYIYSDETLEFLKSITLKSGPLPCRDQLIVNMLNKHDVPAVYSGDMAIYDEKYLNTTFIPPKQINSIVFTVGHHDKYYEQAYEILEKNLEVFPNSKLYIAFHSKISPKLKKITEIALSLGYEELHLCGDVKNLNIYDEIDLHIGYRLHGHISFLRRRKPSILLIEDARSFGFAKTKGTRIGCFDIYDVKSQSILNTSCESVFKFLQQQLQNNFNEYNQIYKFIDKTYEEFIRPYFNQLSNKLSKE